MEGTVALGTGEQSDDPFFFLRVRAKAESVERELRLS